MAIATWKEYKHTRHLAFVVCTFFRVEVDCIGTQHSKSISQKWQMYRAKGEKCKRNAFFRLSFCCCCCCRRYCYCYEYRSKYLDTHESKWINFFSYIFYKHLGKLWHEISWSKFAISSTQKMSFSNYYRNAWERK